MSTADKRRLSLDQAAEIIFHTSEPTPKQVAKVRLLIERGILAGNLEGRGSTSAESVANYLAKASLYKGIAATPSEKRQDRTRQQREADADMRPIYSDLMKDYFLTVLRRRDAKRKSKAFRTAVLLGQLTALAIILMFCVMLATSGIGAPGELAVVEEYLKNKSNTVEIDEWFPPTIADGGGNMIRVKYRIRGADGQLKPHDSVFTVKGDEVLGLAPTPPERPAKAAKK